MLLISKLIDDPELVAYSMRDIQEKIGISLGAVGNAFRALVGRGFVEVKNNKRSISNMEGLKEHFNNIKEVFPDRKKYIEENY